MWGMSPEALARIREGHSAKADPNQVSEAQQKRDLAKKIEESGIGTCNFCNQEIVKNGAVGFWEAELLLAYCPMAKDSKHKPIVRLTKKEVDGGNP